MDLHNYKRRLERTLIRIEESDILKENKKILMQFHDNCLTEGLGICKIERYLFDLHNYSKMLNKPFMDASKEDIKKVVAEIEKKEWSPHSKHAFKIAIRRLYKSIEGPEEKGVYPERVRWLHSNVKNNQKKLPEDLLTEEEIKKMIEFAQTYRDKALIAVLYESGCRISEVGLLKIKDISFDEYGLKAIVFGKTGARRIRLVSSAPYIQQWLNFHPLGQSPESYIWISRDKKEVLSYARLSFIVKNVAKMAGIKKRIHPHLFRHSRATHLAMHLTEAQMKDYLGWTQSSKMAAIYVHLSGRDTDNAILKLNGIKIDETIIKKEILRSKNCLRCRTINEATNRFCKLCGLPLDEDTQKKLIADAMEKDKSDNIMDELIKDKDVLALLVEKIKQRGLDKTIT